jgi:outer membrane protein
MSVSKSAAGKGLGASVLAAAAILLTVAPAAATDWTVSLGAEGRMVPSFQGSDRIIFAPYPLIDIRRAGTPARFHSPRDGASLGLIESGSFRFGPTVKIDLPRRESDDDDLRGLGNVDWAIEAGLFAEFWPLQWLRTRAEVRQGFGGHHGVVADLTADAVVPVTPKLTLSAGPRLTLVTADANDPYFSVDPTQSAKSGLPVYAAGGGVQSYGFGAQARYQFTPKWESHLFLEYAHLSGDAANSPLVLQRGSTEQIQVGLGASYAFDVPGLW